MFVLKEKVGERYYKMEMEKANPEYQTLFKKKKRKTTTKPLFKNMIKVKTKVQNWDLKISFSIRRRGLGRKRRT